MTIKQWDDERVNDYDLNRDFNNVDTKYDASLTNTMSITDSTSTLDLSGLTDLASVVIENIGDNTAYIRFAATAVVTDFPIRSSEKLDLKDILITRIDAITASGVTELTVIAKESPAIAGTATSDELLTLSATDASSEDSFADSDYKDILIANTGASDAYVFFGATATTSHFKIEGGTTKIFGSTNQQQIATICNAAETTTILAWGIY